MAKHARVQTDEQRTRLECNRKLLLEVIAGGTPEGEDATDAGGLSLVLERFVVPEGQPGIVPFEGSQGVERLLGELSSFSYAQIWQDKHLVGVEGRIATREGQEPLELRCTVGAGAQLVLEVGPSNEITALLEAITAFDRHVHLAAKALGRSYQLLAQGYHPFVESASDIVVVPTHANTLTNAYLSRKGRLARDMMRCTAATQVRLPIPVGEDEACESFRLASALAPVLAFLCDNCLKVRGRTPQDSPRMAHALVWSQVDPARSGIANDTFLSRFGFEAYERWLEGIAPIYFVSDGQVCFSTGTDSLHRVMEERDLSTGEARGLLKHVMPWVRWDGMLTVCAVNALSVRQAAGYAALLKGLLVSSDAREEVSRLLDVEQLDEDEVAQAFDELRAKGWEARVYDRPIAQIAHEIAAIASRHLPDRAERRLLDELAQLWDVGMVPRDTLLHSWERNRPRTREEEAALRWGEGAVIPYDQLEGEPPAGSTSVMHIDQLSQQVQSD